MRGGSGSPKVRSQTKKTILFGNFSQTSDPPHPPLLGTPYPKKYEICNMKYEIWNMKYELWNMQYIPCNSALLAQKTLFLTQKGTVFQIYKSFGIWEDPPFPHVGKNSQIISFFFYESVPNLVYMPSKSCFYLYILWQDIFWKYKILPVSAHHPDQGWAGKLF